MCEILHLACPRQKYLWMQRPKITASVLEIQKLMQYTLKKQKSTVSTSALGEVTLTRDYSSTLSVETFSFMY